MSGGVLFVSGDVFFWARVSAAAKSAGRGAVRIDNEAAMQAAFTAGGVSLVIADLGLRSLDLTSWARRWKESSPAPRLVAFGSHVDEAALAAAREAGFDQVMPNSRLQRSLGDLLSASAPPR